MKYIVKTKGSEVVINGTTEGLHKAMELALASNSHVYVENGKIKNIVWKNPSRKY